MCAIKLLSIFCVLFWSLIDAQTLAPDLTIENPQGGYVYLNGKNLTQIVIPCVPQNFSNSSYQEVSLFRIKPTMELTMEKEQITNGTNSTDYGFVTFDNKTGFSFSKPNWTENNTRLLCLIKNYNLDTDLGGGRKAPNATYYRRFYIKIDGNPFNIKNTTMLYSPDSKNITRDADNSDKILLWANVTQPNRSLTDFTWSKDNVDIIFEINSNYNQIINDSGIGLEINKFGLRDNGNFTLSARNIQSNVTKTWTLHVDAPLEVDIEFPQQYFSRNAIRTISCNALVPPGANPNITFSSAPCQDPVNEDCMGNAFNATWTTINRAPARNRMSWINLDKLSVSISVTASSNMTYQCITDYKWGKNNISDTQKKQRLFITLDGDQRELNHSSDDTFLNQMYVGISALKDGTRLSFNCSADFALYSKNISFYFKPDGSKEKNITQNPTFVVWDIMKSSYVFKNSLQVNDAGDADPGDYICKFRKRGQEEIEERKYTVNKSLSTFASFYNTLLILLLVNVIKLITV